LGMPKNTTLDIVPIHSDGQGAADSALSVPSPTMAVVAVGSLLCGSSPSHFHSSSCSCLYATVHAPGVVVVVLPWGL